MPQSPIPRRRPTRPFGDFRAFPHHTRPLGGRARAGVGRASPRDTRYERGCRRRRAPRDVAFSARPPSWGQFRRAKIWLSRAERTSEMRRRSERLCRARGFPAPSLTNRGIRTALKYAFPVTQKRASSGKRRRIFPRQTRQLRGNPKFFAVCFRVRRNGRARDFSGDLSLSVLFSRTAITLSHISKRVRFDAAATRASRAYTYSNLDNTQPVQ